MSQALERFRSAARFHGFKVPDAGTRWRMACPGHGGKDPNLAVAVGDHGLLFTCHSHGCEAPAIAAALGLSTSDLFDTPAPTRTEPWREVAAFSYVDEEGRELFQVVRQEQGDSLPGRKAPKKFLQRSRATDGTWAYKLDGVRRVLYQLPRVLEAIAEERLVFVVEGEKAATAAEALGFVATCNPGGAERWTKDGADVHGFSASLEGAHVVLLPDNDEPGRKHVLQVGASLAGLAASVRVLELPGLPPKADVHDWREAGGTAEQLHALLDQAAPFDTWAGDFKARPAAVESEPAGEATSLDVGDTTMLGDAALADLFSDRHAGRFRFTAEWHRWQAWDDISWRNERTLLVFDSARALLQEIARGVDKAAERRRLTSSLTISAIERLARSDRRHAAVPEQWDAHPWLLSTPGGVVDLKTGALRAPRQQDYLLRVTGVAPDFGMRPSTWLQFLDRVTRGDREYQDYLQRVVGYCLVGQVREHALFFVHGPGGSGKGTFLRTLLDIAGEFGQDSPVETFMESRFPRHPTELAVFQGKRLVIAQEIQQGARWNEARIKSLTGGDPITARYMRGDFFTFRPQFTLILAGNHKPSFTAVDRAIRRRLCLLPFTEKIEDSEVDVAYSDRLRAEYPAILAWGIQGTRAYLERGLAAPSVVATATDEYLEEQDHVAEWIAERCLTAPDGARGDDWREELQLLFDSWSLFATDRGVSRKSARDLGEALRQRGFEPVRMGKDRRWGRAGLVLTQVERARVLARRRAQDEQDVAAHDTRGVA